MEHGYWEPSIVYTDAAQVGGNIKPDILSTRVCLSV